MGVLSRVGRSDVGKMDRVVYLFKPEISRDETNAKVETLKWAGSELGLKVWAELLPVQRKMQEIQMGGQEKGLSEKHWRIRYREGIDNTVVLKWRGDFYDVIGVLEGDRDQFLTLKTELRR